MSIKLHTSSLCHIKFYADNLKIKQVWKAPSAQMSADEFMREQTILADILKKHKPHYLVADARNTSFIIYPELQEWNAKEVLSHFSLNGGKKCGILVPVDIYAQISIEQALEEADETFETRYFDNEEEMRIWLRC